MNTTARTKDEETCRFGSSGNLVLGSDDGRGIQGSRVKSRSGLFHESCMTRVDLESIV